MPKNIREVPGFNILDPQMIDNVQYNDAAGSIKTTEVGAHLLPFPELSGGSIIYTTNLTSILPLPKAGMCLAVYNNDTVIHSITLGDSNSQTALAAGVTDATGHVGVPCVPGRWTHLATGLKQWVIADSANLMVFLVSDNSQIVNQIPAQTLNY